MFLQIGKQTKIMTMETDDKLLKVYEQIFWTWRSRVDSYWQRSNYFAAFESAAIAGCWYVLSGDHGQPWAGCTLSGLGLFLTAVWLCNNHKTHKYVRYWWKKPKAIEEKCDMKSFEADFVTQHPGGGFPRYSLLLQAVPAMFLVAWIALFARSLLLLCGCLPLNH